MGGADGFTLAACPTAAMTRAIVTSADLSMQMTSDPTCSAAFLAARNSAPGELPSTAPAAAYVSAPTCCVIFPRNVKEMTSLSVCPAPTPTSARATRDCSSRSPTIILLSLSSSSSTAVYLGLIPRTSASACIADAREMCADPTMCTSPSVNGCVRTASAFAPSEEDMVVDDDDDIHAHKAKLTECNGKPPYGLGFPPLTLRC